MDYLLTHTGRKARLFEPDPGFVALEDIASSLAKLCRFTGHCRGFYSVAQHSVFVADILQAQGYSPRTQLFGLLHDAHEAYTGDINTPLKSGLYTVAGPFTRHICVVQKSLQTAVETALIGDETPIDGTYQIIKRADLIALATEKRDLMPSDDEPWPVLDGVEPWHEKINPDALWIEGCLRFTQRYWELRSRLNETSCL